MGHIAHLSKDSHNKISFIKSFTKYLNKLVKQILYKQIFKLFPIKKFNPHSGLILPPEIMI